MIILKNTDVSNELATAPVSHLLLKLAIPTVIAQLVNLLYNVVDRIYIGHMPDTGSTALTGVGLCFPVIYLISAFTMLIAQGGAPKAAISMGSGDEEKAQRILNNCFVGLIFEAIVLTAAFWFFGEKLLWIFGCSDQTIVYALPYMRIYSSGSIFVMLALGMNLFITTQGFTRFSMASVLIGAIINIILDPVFIYGLNMGVKGAALATIISQGCSCIWILLFLTGKKTRLRLNPRYMKPEPSIIISALALGLAPFIMQATEALLNIAFNSSLQKYGGDIAVGAMTISSTVQQMVWIPAQGIGQGAQTTISYNYGDGNAQRIRDTFKCMLTVAMILLTSFWLLVQLFPQAFVHIFNSSEEMLSTAGWALRVYMAVFCFFSIQMSVQQTFTALGKAKASLFIACLRKIILLIPLIYILPHFFENKVFAVFLAEPLSDSISIIASAITFYFVFGKTMQQLEHRSKNNRNDTMC